MKSSTTRKLRNALFGALGGLAGAVAARAYWRVVHRFRGDIRRSRMKEAAEKSDVVVAIDEDGAISYVDFDDPEVQIFERLTGHLPNPEEIERLELGMDLIMGGARGALMGLLRGERDDFGYGSSAAFGAMVWLVRRDLWNTIFHNGEARRDMELEFHRLGARLTNSLTMRTVTQGLHRVSD